MRSLTGILAVILAALCILTGCAERRPGGGQGGADSSIEFEPVPEDESVTETETETQTETVIEETETEKETETETETEAQKIPVDGLTLDKYEVRVKVGESDMPWVTMTPADATDKSEIWESDNSAVATVDAYGNIRGVAEGDCKVTVKSADNPSCFAEVAVHVDPKPAETEPSPATDGNPPVVTAPTYINGILIANKTYALPADYNPGIDPTAYAALMEMFAGASSEGISLWIASGFRSYETQRWLYNNYVAMDGKEAADTYSARPGHSEHQTGLAFDLNVVADYFADTPEGKWLAANCWKYGFVIRYQAGKESITGYKYEPWHVRYLGKDVAKALYDSGLCLEEYLDITSVYSY